MKRKNQSEIVKDRIIKSISKEAVIPESFENMLINDLEKVLKSYFVYQNGELRIQFSNNGVTQELNITLSYQRFKDIKVL